MFNLIYRKYGQGIRWKDDILSGLTVALALVPKFAAALSILGSGYIAFDVLRIRRHESRGLRTTRGPYLRLMLGMSISDLMMSGGIFMSTWPSEC